MKLRFQQIAVAGFFLVIFGFVLTTSPLLLAGGKDVEYVEIKSITLSGPPGTQPRWNVRAYQAREKALELTDYPARLCFGNGSCLTSDSWFAAEAIINGKHYAFQFVDILSDIQLSINKEAEKAVLFVPRYSGGGSGSLYLLTAWAYEKNSRRFINLLPKATCITEQGEFRFISFPEIEVGSVLITADYLWGDGETHFSPHRYEIAMYAFVQKRGFVLAGSYITDRKYKSLEDTDKVDVIGHENENILKHLKKHISEKE